jgi:signal transduction histidine kinase
MKLFNYYPILIAVFLLYCKPLSAQHTKEAIKFNQISKQLSEPQSLSPKQFNELFKQGKNLAKILNQDTCFGRLDEYACRYYLAIGNNHAAWDANESAKEHYLHANNYQMAAQTVANKLGILTYQGLYDSMLVVAKQSESLIAKANKRTVISIKNACGTALRNLGKQNEALVLYKEALDIAVAENDTANIVNMFVNIGSTYNNLDSTLFWYKKVLNYNTPEHKVAYAIALYQIGYTYLLRDDVLKDSALHYFFEAEKRIDDYPNPVYKGMVQNALGGFFSEKQEYKLALPHLHKAYNYVKNIESPLADVLVHSLALCHIGLKNFDSAQTYLNQFKLRIEKFPDDRNWMHYYQAASGLLIKRAEFNKRSDTCSTEILGLKNKALYYAKRIEDDRIGLEEIFESIYCVKTLGNTPHELIIKKEFLNYCEFFKPIIEKSERKISYCDFLTSYAELAFSMNDEKLSLALYKELAQNLIAMQVERYNEGQNEALIKYKSELKDAEISYGKRINWYLTLAIGLLVIIALIIIINQIRTVRLNKQIITQKQLLEIQKDDLENVSMVKDRLFSVISHDMRMPLSSLLSYIHLLENKNLPQEKVTLYTQNLKEKLHYTTEMMDNILNWAHSQMRGYKPFIELVDVEEIVVGIEKLIEHDALRKNIEVKNELNKLLVKSDLNMITMIIRNLLSNAIKFAPKNGSIIIQQTEHNQRKGIIIRDNGSGLSTDWLYNFNNNDDIPLQSTIGTAQEKGTGIGLMLCKNLAKIIGVTIVASNHQDGGAVFTIYFNN